MINLLPADVKKYRQFGRLNRLLVRVLSGITFIGVAATLVMLSGLQLTRNDEKLLDEIIDSKTAIYETSKVYDTQASELKSDLATIRKVFDREVQLSKLLVEIASAIPVNVELTSLSLTGNNTAPLQITAKADSQALAGTLRRNLVDSGVFEAADLQSVSLQSSEDGPDRYNVSILGTLTGAAEQLRQEKAAAQAAAAAAQAAQTPSGSEQGQE